MACIIQDPLNLQYTRPSPSSKYNSLNNKGIKHITRLDLRLSNRRNRKLQLGAWKRL